MKKQILMLIIALSFACKASAMKKNSNLESLTKQERINLFKAQHNLANIQYKIIKDQINALEQATSFPKKEFKLKVLNKQLEIAKTKRDFYNNEIKYEEEEE